MKYCDAWVRELFISASAGSQPPQEARAKEQDNIKQAAQIHYNIRLKINAIQTPRNHLISRLTLNNQSRYSSVLPGVVERCEVWSTYFLVETRLSAAIPSFGSWRRRQPTPAVQRHADFHRWPRRISNHVRPFNVLCPLNNLSKLPD